MITIKKITYFMITIIQIALLVGGVVFEKLCKSKMGVMRHVMYTNSKWEKAYPIELLNHVFGLTLLLAAVIFAVLLFQALRKKHIRGFYLGMVLCFVLSAGGGACAILLASKETWLSYYYISMVVIAIVVLQMPKAIYGLLSQKK